MTEFMGKGNKDPAFLFYPNDYIGGTMGMTFEEKGAYMDLLMMQFNRGHMTYHMIGQTLGQNVDKLWSTVKTKFVTDDQGLYYNERLEEEINKRKRFISSRCNNRSGMNQHKKSVVVDKEKVGHMIGHVTYHMEDEDENINNNTFLDIKDRGVGEEKTKEDQLSAYMAIFNSFPFKQIKSLSGKRITLLNEILAVGGEKLFNDVLIKAKGSSYLRGDVNGQKAAFDWLFIKANYEKVLEGFYDDNKQVKKIEQITTKTDPFKMQQEEERRKREEFRKLAVKPSELKNVLGNTKNLKALIANE